MKIEAEILSVENCADHLRVTLQGKAVTAGEWQPVTQQVITVPVTSRNARTFYVGRVITLDVQP